MNLAHDGLAVGDVPEVGVVGPDRGVCKKEAEKVNGCDGMWGGGTYW